MHVGQRHHRHDGGSVGNLKMLPEAVRWFGSIAIGVLGTAIWVVLIKQRMAGERDSCAFVTVRIAEPEAGSGFD